MKKKLEKNIYFKKVEAPKKSAQSFLGSASGLVNLDALVTRPKQAPTNPFGNMGTSPTGCD